MPRWYSGVSVRKDPSDIIDIQLDFSPQIKSTSISTLSVNGTNLTIDSSSESSGVATARVSGGTNGTEGEVRYTATMSDGTRLERTVLVDVQNL